MPAPHASRFPVYRIAAVCVLILVAAACSGCSSAEPSTERPNPADEQLLAAVRDYNSLLIEGFRTLDMSVLEPVATQEQAEREYVYMSALGEGRMRLEATLVSLDFVAVDSEATTPTVDTHEVWDYRRVNIDTNELMAEETGVEYDLRYSLTKVNGRWIVAATEPLNAPAAPDTD